MSSTTISSSVRVRPSLNSVKRKKRERILDDLKSLNEDEIESVTNELFKKIECDIDDTAQTFNEEVEVEESSEKQEHSMINDGEE